MLEEKFEHAILLLRSARLVTLGVDRERKRKGESRYLYHYQIVMEDRKYTKYIYFAFYKRALKDDNFMGQPIHFHG